MIGVEEVRKAVLEESGMCVATGYLIYCVWGKVVNGIWETHISTTSSESE